MNRVLAWMWHKQHSWLDSKWEWTRDHGPRKLHGKLDDYLWDTLHVK